VLGGEAEELQRLRAALGVSSDPQMPSFVFAPGGYLVALLMDSEDGAVQAADLIALYQSIHALLPEGA
jgi:hypothetical protein